MDPPELTNFGSLVRFAITLEDAAAAFFDGLAGAGGDAEVPALAKDLAGQHRQRRRVLERTRQHVNEMILEPISGLDGRRYVFDTDAGPDAVARGVELEETAARFYADSSDVAKAILADSARAFQKLGEESAKNVIRLRMAPSAGRG